jgi:hypothetical protein
MMSGQRIGIRGELGIVEFHEELGGNVGFPQHASSPGAIKALSRGVGEGKKQQERKQKGTTRPTG